ncbi:tryptophan 7-halogenase, partial [Leptolyngbya cf. ectocarpi LEGE 11479]
MLDSQFDVAVLGGGPAGTAAALVLLKYSNLSVVVVEKSDYENFRIGESLSPGVTPLLDYLGIADQLDQHRSSFGIRAAWNSDEMHSLDFMYTVHGQGISLNRKTFDQTLANAVVDRGGTLLTETKLEHLSSTAQGWQIKTSRGILRSKFCIDATGKSAVLARHQGSRRLLYDHLVGVVGIGEIDKDDDSFTEIEACEHGWWYSAKLPNQRAIFVYLSDSDLIQRDKLNKSENWLNGLRKTQHLVKRANRCQFTSSIRLFPANTAHLDKMYGNNWIAAGDAAISYDPLSARGIPSALDTGIQAARLACGWLTEQTSSLDNYQANSLRNFQEYLNVWTRYYQLEQRWPTSTFWRRRQAIIQLDPTCQLTIGKDFQPSNLYLNKQDY